MPFSIRPSSTGSISKNKLAGASNEPIYNADSLLGVELHSNLEEGIPEGAFLQYSNDKWTYATVTTTGTTTYISGGIGPKGNIGLKGQKGDVGPVGFGIDGATGAKGEKGIPGINGTNGAKGDPGVDSNYSTSFDGPHILGNNRNSGAALGTVSVDTGLSYQGGEYIIIAGDPSPDNFDIAQVTAYDSSTGVMSWTNVYRSTVYSNNQNWLINLTGVPGIEGAKGQKGAVGPKGLDGTAGVKGDKGQKGEEATDGINGDKGQKGEVGPKGLDGTATAGVKGEKGEKGESVSDSIEWSLDIINTNNPNWSFNYNLYENTSILSGLVIQNSVELTNGIVAAFINGEVRGISDSDLGNWIVFPPTGKTIVNMTIYGDLNDNGEEITFKLYYNQNLYDLSTTLTFTNNEQYGDATNPIVMNVTNNINSFTDKYVFSGPGFPSPSNNPTLYLMRGHTYKFTNNTGGHPFRIQSDPAVSGGGTEYNSGVVNNNAGNGSSLIFTVPMDSPNILYYQCTLHPSMTGTIHIINSSTNSGSNSGSSFSLTATTPLVFDSNTDIISTTFTPTSITNMSGKTFTDDVNFTNGKIVIKATTDTNIISGVELRPSSTGLGGYLGFFDDDFYIQNYRSGKIILDNNTQFKVSATNDFNSGTITNLSTLNSHTIPSGTGTLALLSDITDSEIEWTLTANGMSDYIFSGPGFPSPSNDPTLYLMRGHTYKFTNNTGGHPFRIQSEPAVSGGGTEYNSGVVNNNAGNGSSLIFTVPMDSPNTLYYQCVSHKDMTGTINIINSASSASSSESLSNLIASTPLIFDSNTNIISTTFTPNSTETLSNKTFDYTSNFINGVKITTDNDNVDSRNAYIYGTSIDGSTQNYVMGGVSDILILENKISGKDIQLKTNNGTIKLNNNTLFGSGTTNNFNNGLITDLSSINVNNNSATDLTIGNSSDSTQIDGFSVSINNTKGNIYIGNTDSGYLTDIKGDTVKINNITVPSGVSDDIFALKSELNSITGNTITSSPPNFTSNNGTLIQPISTYTDSTGTSVSNSWGEIFNGVERVKWVVGGQDTTNTIHWSNDGLTWVGAGNIINTRVKDIKWNGSMFVAVGSGSSFNMAYSYDGKTWEGINQSIINDVRCIYWGNNMWMAGGDSSTIITSPDGINWSDSLVKPSLISLSVIKYYNNKWVIGGTATTGSNPIEYSTDDGASWTGTGAGIFDSCSDLEFNGHFWIATGIGANQIAVSGDLGVTWGGTGTGMFDYYATGIAWNGVTWMATGKGSNTIVYSETNTTTSSMTWTAAPSPFSIEATSIEWNGYSWVVTGQGGTTLAYSTQSKASDVGDPMTWTSISNIFSVIGSKVETIPSVKYVLGGMHLNTRQSLAWSYDSIIWRSIGSTYFNTTVSSVATDGSMWVAAGVNNNNTNPLAYSYDGVNWNYTGNNLFDQGNYVSWENNLWVAGGSLVSGTTKSFTIGFSSDGITWNGVTNPLITDIVNFIKWNGSMWLAGGYGGSIIAYSTDNMATNMTWTPVAIPTGDFTGAYDAQWIGNNFIITGDAQNKLLYTTYDGSNLTADILPISNNASYNFSIAWNGTDKLVVASGGNSGSYKLSYSDGTITGGSMTWTYETFNSTFDNRSTEVIWTGNMFVAVGYGNIPGSGNAVMHSTDGINWTSVKTADLFIHFPQCIASHNNNVIKTDNSLNTYYDMLTSFSQNMFDNCRSIKFDGYTQYKSWNFTIDNPDHYVYYTSINNIAPSDTSFLDLDGSDILFEKLSVNNFKFSGDVQAHVWRSTTSITPGNNISLTIQPSSGNATGMFAWIGPYSEVSGIIQSLEQRLTNIENFLVSLGQGFTV